MTPADATYPSQKPHLCVRCGRRFARLEHLQRHTRTHTKEKPFTCFCGRSFTRNDLLKRHRQRAHSIANSVTEDAPSVAVSRTEQGQDDTVVVAAEAPISRGHDAPRLSASERQTRPYHEDTDALHSPLHDFATFMESIGMVPDWDSLDFFDIEPFPQQAHIGTFQLEGVQRPPLLSQENHLLEGNTASMPPTLAEQMSGQEVAQEHQPGSGPTTAEVHAVADVAGSEQALTPIPWKLSQQQWQTLADSVTAARESLPPFTLPSRPAMSRYMQSYVHHFHKHYPMIHLPTYCPNTSPIWLTLAIAAVGAQCRFESRNGQSLYEAARAATLEQRRLDSLDETRASPAAHRTAMIQTLVLLMVYGAWDANTGLLDAALDLQNMLSAYIRTSLRDHPPAGVSGLQWNRWIRLEMHRRTILIAYAYLVIQSMTYDLPPVVLNNEIQHLQLPCESAAWEAQSEQEWRDALQRSTHTSANTKDVLRYLFQDTTESVDVVFYFSAIGSFIVLQALIQRIYMTRQLNGASSLALPKVELDALQLALIRWKTICQRTVSSDLDRRHADDPVPFTSAAFLALAFARLHIDLGPCRQLHTRNPRQIATALLSTPVPECSPQAVPALLHAAHALSVPVLMGVDSILGSHTLSWSCEHSLCGLEAGIFLWRWLQSAGESLTWDNLDPNEKGIVSWVLFSVSETLQSVEASELGLDHDTVLSELSFPKLGILVLKIWARIFSSNTSWAITNEIGASLRLLAEAAETN